MRQRAELTRATWFASSSEFISVAASSTVFNCEVVDDRESVVVLRITGPAAAVAFKDEAGGHRWQRVPPNEKRGRVQTSTVTVAVLEEPTDDQVKPIPEHELEWKATRGSGAGGQARNKTSNAIQLWHKPTGIMVRSESERSQAQNLATAKAMLRARLFQARAIERSDFESASRRAQLGGGARGDKRRTIRVQAGEAIDHVTGRRWRFRDYERGQW